MTKKRSIDGDRGDHNDDDNNGGSVLHRFQRIIKGCLERTARRIIKEMPRALFEVDIGVQPFGASATGGELTWTDRSYFLGSVEQYRRVTKALRKAGFRYTYRYIAPTDSGTDRDRAFEKQCKAILRKAARNFKGLR